jgi:hypothetical protein
MKLRKSGVCKLNRRHLATGDNEFQADYVNRQGNDRDQGKHGFDSEEHLMSMTRCQANLHGSKPDNRHRKPPTDAGSYPEG